jgi:hypothetical protein
VQQGGTTVPRFTSKRAVTTFLRLSGFRLRANYARIEAMADTRRRKISALAMPSAVLAGTALARRTGSGGGGAGGGGTAGTSAQGSALPLGLPAGASGG